MDINKMTERTQQALIDSQELAKNRKNPELTELHLLQALAEQDESMLLRILSESISLLLPFNQPCKRN